MLTSNYIQKTATPADAPEDINTSSQLGFNIEIELNNLAELIFNSTHIPLTDLIISEAEGYACLIVKSAEEKASQILQESTIMRQAELDGAKVRLKTERECEELKQATLTEIEQLRESAIAESRAIQIGADNYADDVLGDIEQRLQQMLKIVHNGRQQLDRQ